MKRPDWFPIQKCLRCGKYYWGDFPKFQRRGWRFRLVWKAAWKEYCSAKCCKDSTWGKK